MTTDDHTDDDYEYVFVASYRDKRTGRLMVAAHYGLKAWRLKVRKRQRDTGRDS